MKKKIGAVLTAFAIMAGAGVATATAAQASTLVGPFATIQACTQSQDAYERAGRFINQHCYRADYSYYPYYFRMM